MSLIDSAEDLIVGAAIAGIVVVESIGEAIDDLFE